MAPRIIHVGSATDARDVIHRAVQTLVEGGIVAFPTETVYGLAASALNEEAAIQLADLKEKESASAFALAVKSAEDALDYVPDSCSLSRRLARRCWPGPVTLVLPDQNADSLVRKLPERVQQLVVPNGTLGLRVPGHRLVLDVLRLLPGPLLLTSANGPADRLAVTAEDVLQQHQDQIGLILDDGRCQFGQPSSVVQVVDGQLKVLREGVVSEATLKRLASVAIVFVCTGNTCRSPMAEMLAKQRISEALGCSIEQLEDRGVKVMSAGISTGAGGRATPEAKKVMEDRKLDLNGHVTQPVSERLVRQADLLLTMTRMHRQAIVTHWPDAAERTHVLCPDGSDVSDPIGGPYDLYRVCADQIDAAIQQRLPEIESLVQSVPH
ncbi:MAG: L-threonylcarbamoyladenylate synthase [Pirellulaceae bacterium]